jgi:putative transposase
LVSWIGFYDVGAQPPQVVGSPRRRRAANGESESVPTGQWATLARSVADAAGRREVVRNGHLPERSILTGIGPVRVKPPRVHDRRPAAEQERFSSRILPPYLQKTRSVEELMPWLHLKGASTGDFTEALAARVGPEAPELIASTVTRLKSVWEQDFKAWNHRSLKDARYVYLWADGVHFNIRLEENRQCILVLMGATADGKKELIAITDGHAESEQCWKQMLLDVKQRGLRADRSLQRSTACRVLERALVLVTGGCQGEG